MRAAIFLGPNELDVRNVPSPKAKLVARVRACAVCGYDVRVFRNGHRKVKPPVILGHEICAELVGGLNIGEKLVEAGSRVAIYPQVPCLECHYCRAKQYNMCLNLKELGSTLDGGFAELIAIPDNIVQIGGLVPIPTSVSDEQAALLEPLACCINGLSRMGLPKSKSSNVVIIGDGPVGIMHLMLCKLYGDNKVCLVGKVTSRMKTARELGADLVLEYDPTSTAQTIREHLSGAGADYVVVATSAPASSKLAEQVIGRNSVINLFAGTPGSQNIDMDTNYIHYNQTSIIGSFGCLPDQLSMAARLVAKRKSISLGL